LEEDGPFITDEVCHRLEQVNKYQPFIDILFLKKLYFTGNKTLVNAFMKLKWNQEVTSDQI